MELEDKAKLFDEVCRAQRDRLSTSKKGFVRVATRTYNLRMSRIMRDAERYGFL